jgi:prolyl oligopeptidase
MRARSTHLMMTLCLVACGAAPEPAPMKTPTADPHAWLEDIDGAPALEWVESQNTRTLTALQADPRYATLEADALKILEASDRIAYPGLSGMGLTNYWQDADHVRGLWRVTTEASYRTERPEWTTLFDLDALAKLEGRNWVWKGAHCLDPDDTRCLIELSDGGKDAVEIREFDAAQRAFVPGGFTLSEGKQDAVWIDADTVAVAREWGPGTMTTSGYPFVVKVWRRGTPIEAAVEVYRGTPDDMGAWPAVVRGDGQARLAFVRMLNFYDAEIAFARDLTGASPPTRLALPAKTSMLGLLGGRLVVSIDEPWMPVAGTPPFDAGSVLALDLEATLTAQGVPQRVERVFTPTARQAVQSVALTAGRVVIAYTDNVRGRLLTVGPDPKSGALTEAAHIEVEDNASVSLLSTRERDPRLVFSVESYLSPPQLFMARDGAQAAERLQRSPPRFDSTGMTVEQREATSKDGTRIPYFVVRRADAPLNGETPTLLYGYGGFQISLTPAYLNVAGKLWVERGGAYVIANIRGGGEFGPTWHQAGLKTQRQRIYDDFEAVARALIKDGVTRPDRLGIQGGSNGGLLMGVQLTQHPELYRAVVIEVPLLDMLRYHTLLAGASWMAEYGDPDVPEEAAFLKGISPYHNLRAETLYPEPLIVTSTRDDRVHPGHARKFAARLAELGKPFLYWENTDGGHSAAANLRAMAKRRALTYTYLLRKLADTPSP